MTAAAKAADLFVDRNDLTPPVDVERLIGDQGCHLEECAWPYDCDAVITDLETDAPRIFVKAGMPRLRKRFTMGHELGHVVLGWHLNTVMCDAAPDAHDDPTVLGYDQEAEANEFAARVLVPVRFRREIAAAGTDLRATLDALEIADVSAAAGLIAIGSYLPPGIVLRTSSLGSPVITPSTSPGVKRLASDGRWSDLKARSRDAGKVTHQGQLVHWYSFWDVREPDVDDDPRDTKTIYASALAKAGYEGEALHRFRTSLSGVIGAALTDRTITEAATLLARLYQRLEMDDKFTELLEIEDFHLMLHRKAREAAARRRE